MSKPVNPTIIGGFVLGGAALLIVSIMLFSGGALWDDTFDCVLYFDESLSGLDAGAPVEFMGVRVGTVTDVRLEYDAHADGEFFRPVEFQLESRRFTYTHQRIRRESNPGARLQKLVDNGMRARLATQSMLTGKLKVELAFFPHTPVTLMNRENDPWEVPTIPSPLRQVVDEASHLPFSEIVRDAHKVIESLAEILDPANARALTQRAEAVLEQSERSMLEVQTAVERMDLRMEELLTSLTSTSDQMGALLNPHAPMRGELTELILDIRQTSRAFRHLLMYLEQHPEALLRGKAEGRRQLREAYDGK